MPAPPEIPQGTGLKGLAEVFRQRHAQHSRCAPGHICVAGKIKIHKKRRNKKRRQAGKGMRPRLKARLCQGKQVFRQQQLFSKPQNEKPKPLRQPRPGNAGLARRRRKCRKATDRPCRHLGKKGKIQKRIAQAAWRVAPKNLQRVGDSLNGDEGKAQRPGHAQQLQGKQSAQRPNNGGDRALFAQPRQQCRAQQQAQGKPSPLGQGKRQEKGAAKQQPGLLQARFLQKQKARHGNGQEQGKEKRSCQRHFRPPCCAAASSSPLRPFPNSGRKSALGRPRRIDRAFDRNPERN